METTQLDSVQCKRLAIVDNNGIERVRLSADQTGGRMEIVGREGNHGGFVLSFYNDEPSIAILDKNGKLIVNLMVAADGGLLNILGKDGKTKITLFVDDGRGVIESGEDVFNS